MHNIVLHISIYLFPWLHVLCDDSPLIMPENMRFWPYSYQCFSWNIKFCWVACLNMCSYAHNASMKMTLHIMAVNTLTFTPTKFF